MLRGSVALCSVQPTWLTCCGRVRVEPEVVSGDVECSVAD